MQAGLRAKPRRWLVTGVAGFIASNLAESLLKLDQEVVGLDNFATGKRANLHEVRDLVGPDRWASFRFVEGDVASPEVCREAMAGVDVVLQQAALGSVPRSIEDPLHTHHANLTGFLNMLVAARDIAVPGRPSSIDLAMARECHRQIWEWVYQPPCIDIEGFFCRSIIAAWIFVPHLRSYTMTEMAARFGKKKQSLGRWVEDFKKTFPELSTLEHFRHERLSNIH